MVAAWALLDRCFDHNHDRADSAAIDPKHAELRAGGFCFWSNILNDPDAIEASKAKARNEGATDVVVNPNAYDCYGRLVSNCVSVWCKKPA